MNRTGLPEGLSGALAEISQGVDVRAPDQVQAVVEKGVGEISGEVAVSREDQGLNPRAIFEHEKSKFRFQNWENVLWIGFR
jgi:hypothetical protein